MDLRGCTDPYRIDKVHQFVFFANHSGYQIPIITVFQTGNPRIHFLEMPLNVGHVLTVPNNFKQVLIPNEVKPGKRYTLRLQIVAQRLLDLCKHVA